MIDILTRRIIINPFGCNEIDGKSVPFIKFWKVNFDGKWKLRHFGNHLWFMLPKIIDSMKIQVIRRLERCLDFIMVNSCSTVCTFYAEKGITSRTRICNLCIIVYG